MQTEIRFHGFGGEGVVRASELLGKAAVKCGKWAQSFPYFGTEIRGAAVKAFTRVGDNPINQRCFIYEPDVLVITNRTLVRDREVWQGLKDSSKVLINGAEPEELKVPGQVFWLNATSLGYELFQKPIVNTLLLGALIKLTQLVPLTALAQVIEEEFTGRARELNVKAINKGFAALEPGGGGL
ncbi:MAG: pyruvate ferredoxin oxidoreductase gamma subunit [Clostridia bacterium]|nr:pyruvate ferredoxin oxidoreductase gamma subunit [Clostridia bacterium]